MLATTLSDHAADKTTFQIEAGVLDVTVRQAVSRMIAHCEQQPDMAKFLARGLVVDSLGNVATQIRDYFPTHINVDAIIDDLSFVVAENAKSSKQRFQEVTLSYIADGIIPKSSQANLQSFIKWYSTDNILGGDYDKHHMKLNPGWGGGASEPTAMLKYLNLGTKKGFLLEVKTLNIKDAKARELMADLPMIQAFGGDTGAISAAVDAINAGGDAAKDVQAIIDQIVEIKTLQAALNNAGDTPEAGNIAAALAVKTEALGKAIDTHTPETSVASPTTETSAKKENVASSQPIDVKNPAQIVLTNQTQNGIQPSIIKAALSTVQKTVIKIQTRQMAQVVNSLATALPPAIVARAANDLGPKGATVVAVAKLVQEIKTVAATQNLPVRDVIAISMMPDAPRHLLAPVEKLTQILSQPAAIQNLMQSLPLRIAETVHKTLTQPTLKQAIQTPVNIGTVASTIQAVAQKIENPTLKIAAQMVQQTVTQNTEVQAIAPALKTQALQNVVENIQALQISNSVPANAKPTLHIIEAQLQTAIVQATAVAPQVPATPITIPRDVPLGALQETFKIDPTPMPAAPQALITPQKVDISGNQNTHANKEQPSPDNVVKTQPAETPTAETAEKKASTPLFSDRATSSIADAIKPDTETEKKDSPTSKGKCANCFGNCATCGVGAALMAELNSIKEAPASKLSMKPQMS